MNGESGEAWVESIVRKHRGEWGSYNIRTAQHSDVEPIVQGNFWNFRMMPKYTNRPRHLIVVSPVVGPPSTRNLS